MSTAYFTAADVRDALYTRIDSRVPGLHRAETLSGVEGKALTALPAFEVRLGAQAPVGNRQQGEQRMVRAFAVRLMASMALTRGTELHTDPLRLEAQIRNALQTRADSESDLLRYIDNTIVYLGSDEPEPLSGGSLYLQTSRYQIQFTECVGA